MDERLNKITRGCGETNQHKKKTTKNYKTWNKTENNKRESTNTQITHDKHYVHQPKD